MRLTYLGYYLVIQIVLILIFNPKSISAQNLSLINKIDSNVKHPKVSYDGSQMVLLADYDGKFQPYLSKIDTGAWQTPQPIFDQEVNAKFEFKYPQLNFDNSIIYFSAKPLDKTDYDIYFSELKNGKWSSPELIPININTDVDELSPTVSANGKKILFTRPLPLEAKADDFCQQIYIVEKKETGNWSSPELLPPLYNTGCVCAPYYTSDNKTFYYSSYEEILDAEGKKVSKKQFNIFWGKTDGFLQYNPKPIVSFIGEEDNVSFSIGSDSIIFFGTGEIFSSNKKRWDSKVQSKILPSSFKPDKVTLLKGKVQDENGSPVQAIVDIVDPYTSKIYQQVPCDKNGNYQAFLPQGRQYSVLASKETYSIQSQLIETKEKIEVIDFNLFQSIEIIFNIYDEDFFFPLNTQVSLYDENFKGINISDIESGGKITVDIGKELNVIFSTENYFEDTLNLPFQEEVIFSKFDFDIELVRKLKQIGFSFTDDKTGNNLGLEITVFNVTRNEKTKRKVKDGKITLELRDGEVYEISTSAQGYSYFTSELDLSKDDEMEGITGLGMDGIQRNGGVFEIKAALKSVKDQAIILNNIIFGYNSYDLNAFSYSELNKLATYLQENDTYHVEISAHTDDAGHADYNLKLSNLRANTVVEYLQDHAIKRDRLKAKGLGESQPISPNDTDENKAKNRRVEFKILNNSK